jgi:hypothetical protein
MQVRFQPKKKHVLVKLLKIKCNKNALGVRVVSCRHPDRHVDANNFNGRSIDKGKRHMAGYSCGNYRGGHSHLSHTFEVVNVVFIYAGLYPLVRTRHG